MKSSRLQKVLNHFTGLLLFAFIFVNALQVFAGPGKTTYQAKIVKPDGYPLEASSVNFKFTILDPAGSCILYSETYSSVNMGSTGGLISFALGSGVKTYPVSATTFEQVFSNITPSLSCDAGGPVSYTPAATDIRKIVMQFHDGSGWQTLPAMSINAVPYAMYANEATKLNGLQASDFVQLSTVPTCAASEALRYTGAGFSCVAVGGGGSVTSSTVITALGYTPADGVSVTTLTANVSSVSSTVFSVSSTVTSLQNSVAASFAAVTSSQWTTSGTNIFYNTGNIGIGTTTPVTSLDVSGGVRIGAESTTCAPALAGTLRYNASNVEYCNGTSWQAFGVSGAGITNFNGSTSGTQSFATGTGGTAPNIVTANGVHTLNIPLASTGSVTAGLISNTDYTTFSNKITSSAASIAQVLGYVPADNAASGTYAQKANNLSDLTNATTARTNLGLGTFATASSIDLGSASATGTLAVARLPSFTGDATVAAASNTIILSDSGVTAGTYTKVTVDSKGRVTSSSVLASSDVTTALGYAPASATASTQWTTSGSAIYYNTGNVGIGTSNPVSILHLRGAPAATANYGLVSIGNGPFDGSSSGFFTGNANGVVHAINTAAGFTGEFTHYQNGTSDARFIVKSDGSVVSGRGTVNGSLSSSFGGLNTVNGVHAFAVGHFNQSSGNYTFSSGLFSTASGDNSTAMGYAITANSLGMTAIGINNVVPTGTSTNTWQGTDPIFVIGNGQGSAPASASTAMTVLKNGNVGIGTTAPTAKLHLASGTTSAAPLKFTSGTLLTSPQSGTMEYDGANFYLTDSTSTRRAIATGSSAGTIDNASNINSSGNITMTPTGSVVVSSTTASTNSSTGALIVNGGLGVAGNLNVAGTISGSAQVLATGFRANQGSPDSNDNSTNGYAFGADGDTGMFSPGSGAANGVLAFYGNNAELMRITASGAVGIGTSTPTAPVEAAKNFGASGAANSILKLNARGTASSGFGGSIDFLSSNEIAQNDFIAARISSAWEVADNGFGLSFFTKNTGANGGATAERMRISNSGNVGIGTTTPAYTFTATKDFVGLSSQTAAFIGGTDAATANTGIYVVQKDNLGLSTNTSYLLNVVQNNNSKMVVTGAGNVGIGTTSPAEELSIFSNVDGDATINVMNPNAGASARAGVTLTNSGTAYGSDSGGILLGGKTHASMADKLYFFANSGVTSGIDIVVSGPSAPVTISTGGPNERMRVAQNGNVGIGTTSPASRLDVAGGGGSVFQVVASANANATPDVDSDFLVRLMPQTTGSEGGHLEFKGSSSYQDWTIDSTAGELRFFEPNQSRTSTKTRGGFNFMVNPSTTSASTQFTALMITNSGNVGVGITSPTSKLDVNGQIAGKSYKTRLFQAGGKSSTSCTLSASNTTMADQFCDLSVTFTLTDPASAQINYTIAMSAGSSGGKHLVTGIDIDGTVVTTVLTGITSQEATPYWSNSQTHFADLATGSHTIKVKYRTPAGGTSNPSVNDWENRILQVMILGYQ